MTNDLCKMVDKMLSEGFLEHEIADVFRFSSVQELRKAYWEASDQQGSEFIDIDGKADMNLLHEGVIYCRTKWRDFIVCVNVEDFENAKEWTELASNSYNDPESEDYYECYGDAVHKFLQPIKEVLVIHQDESNNTDAYIRSWYKMLAEAATNCKKFAEVEF